MFLLALRHFEKLWHTFVLRNKGHYEGRNIFQQLLYYLWCRKSYRTTLVQQLPVLCCHRKQHHPGQPHTHTLDLPSVGDRTTSMDTAHLQSPAQIAQHQQVSLGFSSCCSGLTLQSRSTVMICSYMWPCKQKPTLCCKSIFALWNSLYTQKVLITESPIKNQKRHYTVSLKLIFNTATICFISKMIKCGIRLVYACMVTYKPEVKQTCLNIEAHFQ